MNGFEDPTGGGPAYGGYDPLGANPYGVTPGGGGQAYGPAYVGDPETGGGGIPAGSGTTDPFFAAEPAAAGGGTRKVGTMAGGAGTSISTKKTATMPMPSVRGVAAYTAPTYEESKVRAYAQESAALGISEWRNSLTQNMNKIMSEGNFATRADQMRKMFEGAGTSLASIMKGATAEGVQQYTTEYNALVQEAMAKHEDEVRQAYTQFNADLQSYFQTMQTTSQQMGATGTAPAMGMMKLA